MKTLEDLRLAIDSIDARGRSRRFSPELKADVIAYVRAARGRGVPTARLEADLNVSWNTLARWTQSRGPVGRHADRPRPIPVVVAGPSRPSISLVSPAGWRVDGLTFEQVAALVTAT